MDLTAIALLYTVLLISLVVHEAAHALAAMLGGDHTAYEGGQVTLNPIPHIKREPMGTVVMPLLMLFMSQGRFTFGFASTPYNPIWAYRHPRRAALMSAAGPLSNFLLALLAFFVLKALLASELAEFGSGQGITDLIRPTDPDSRGIFATIQISLTFLYLNILLGLFNLVPLPPLDGAGIVEGLAPRQTAGFFGLVRSQPVLTLVGILVLWQTVLQHHIFIPLLRFALGSL